MFQLPVIRTEVKTCEIKTTEKTGHDEALKARDRSFSNVLADKVEDHQKQRDFKKIDAEGKKENNSKKNDSSFVKTEKSNKTNQKKLVKSSKKKLSTSDKAKQAESDLLTLEKEKNLPEFLIGKKNNKTNSIKNSKITKTNSKLKLTNDKEKQKSDCKKLLVEENPNHEIIIQFIEAEVEADSEKAQNNINDEIIKLDDTKDNLKDNIGLKNISPKEILNEVKKDEKPKLTVVDFRKQKNQKTNKIKQIKTDNKSLFNQSKSNDADQLFLNLKADAGNNVKSTDSVLMNNVEKKSFSKVLKDIVNNKIVKQSGIILKSSNSGEIKLILKPEKLGKVHIRLNLKDNNIAGRIIVENNSVKEIFEQNLDNLYKSFKDAGFEASSLDVSVGSQNKRENSHSRRMLNQRDVESIEDHIPLLTEHEQSNQLINLVV